MNCINFVVPMNPCACGYFPDRERCCCTEQEVSHYLGRISRPLLDRIDICTEVTGISYEELTEKQENETSAQIRKRVEYAHRMQQERYEGLPLHFNAYLNGNQTELYCPLGEKEQKLLKNAFGKLNLSARAYYKIIKTARTIADLEQEERILEQHLLEAIRYRLPGGAYWGRGV